MWENESQREREKREEKTVSLLILCLPRFPILLIPDKSEESNGFWRNVWFNVIKARLIIISFFVFEN